jgi:hypothetical protein
MTFAILSVGFTRLKEILGEVSKAHLFAREQIE